MRKKKKTSLMRGFGFAWRGIVENFWEERNMRLHVLAVIAMTFLGLILQISKGEWLVLVVFFTLVPALELVNSAVESICDVIRDRFKLGYGETKLPRDLAAGAVLWAAAGAVIAGIIIFFPKLI